MAIFSRETLEKFEDAAASVVLRRIDRAFESANVRLGEDPGGILGDRRIQFRRYVAGVDQHDPEQLERLGDALGSLIDAVAESKEAFLVKAAEGDGFVFARGAFRPAAAAAGFGMTHVEDIASLEERGKRLQILANESPAEAVAGAMELVESVRGAIASLKRSGKSPALDRACLEKLGAIVASLGEARGGIEPRHARLAADAAIAYARFVAETHLKDAATRR